MSPPSQIITLAWQGGLGRTPKCRKSGVWVESPADPRSRCPVRASRRRRGGEGEGGRSQVSRARSLALEKVDSLVVTPANKRLLAKIRSIREKIHTAIRQLEELGIGPKDVPSENFDAVAEAIGLLERMNDAYIYGETLPDAVAKKMLQQLDQTDLIARHHVGRMIAHVARTKGASAKGAAGIRCPCESGKPFVQCCGSDTSPAG